MPRALRIWRSRRWRKISETVAGRCSSWRKWPSVTRTWPAPATTSRRRLRRRRAIVVPGLAMWGWSFGQGNSNSNDKAAPQTPGQPAAPAAAQGKRPPAAKTQAEYTAYQAAVALTDPAAQEKGADDFAAKFP